MPADRLRPLSPASLDDADEVKRRLRFPNSGAGQNPLVVVGHLDGAGLAGAGFREILYFVNVSPEAQRLALPEEAGKRWRLHPVHRSVRAADARSLRHGAYDARGGRFTVPARTAMVYVLE